MKVCERERGENYLNICGRTRTAAADLNDELWLLAGFACDLIFTLGVGGFFVFTLR